VYHTEVEVSDREYSNAYRSQVRLGSQEISLLHKIRQITELVLCRGTLELTGSECMISLQLLVMRHTYASNISSVSGNPAGIHCSKALFILSLHCCYSQT